VILADIDVAEVDRVRARIPSLDHTRPFDVTVVPLADEAKLEAAAE
jgi:predicted amidohydrolase